MMVTGAISPINDVGAMTCTGWRYGERPTIWPGWRPGFSNSTSKVMPTQLRLERGLLPLDGVLQPLQPLVLSPLPGLDPCRQPACPAAANI